MNKIEKTKELLGYIKDGIDYETNAIVVGNNELFIVAEALEKQIPMKVKFNRSDCEIYCPSCKKYICENEYFGYPIGEDEHYCRNCGQELLWR